jgi:hypothetical protein
MTAHTETILAALDALGDQIRRMEQRQPAVRYELGELWAKDRRAREALAALTASGDEHDPT